MTLTRRLIALRRTPARRPGFTLIEILVVVAIIVILVGIVIAVGAYVRQSSQRNLTVTTLEQLRGMLDTYKDVGDVSQITSNNSSDFVTKFQAVPELKNRLAGLPQGTFTGTGVKDGFGTDIRFVTTPRTGFQSAGPNGTFGDSDDIYSWDPR